MILVLCLLAVVIGSGYASVWGGPWPVFHSRLGPSVMVALGRGFVNPVTSNCKPLKDFLKKGTPDRIDPRDVPADLPTAPLGSDHRFHLYLLYTVGLWWTAFGISWKGLSTLAGVLFALTVILWYGLLRLALPRRWAFAGGLAALCTPAMYAAMLNLRDMAKAPFMYAVALLVGYILTRRPQGLRLLLLSTLTGAVIGFGYGFRQDMLILLPFSVGMLAVFAPAPSWTKRLLKALSAAAMVAAFLVLAMPVLEARGSVGNTTAHHILGGLFTYNDRLIDTGGTPYIWHNERQLTDTLLQATNESYHCNVLQKKGPLGYCTLEYDTTGKRYLAQLARTFPADMFLRVLAAVKAIIENAPWLVNGPTRTSFDVRNPFINGLAWWTEDIHRLWRAIALSVTVLAVLGLCTQNLRAPLAFLAALFFFCAYPILQFWPRHFFHLSVIPIGLTLLAARHLYVLAGHLRYQWRLGGTYWGGLREVLTGSEARALAGRAIVVAVLVLVPNGVALGALRLYQSGTVHALYEAYAHAPLTEIPATPEPGKAGRLVLRPETTVPYTVAQNAGKRTAPPPVQESLNVPETEPVPKPEPSLQPLESVSPGKDVPEEVEDNTNKPAAKQANNRRAHHSDYLAVGPFQSAWPKSITIEVTRDNYVQGTIPVQQLAGNCAPPGYVYFPVFGQSGCTLKGVIIEGCPATEKPKLWRLDQNEAIPFLLTLVLPTNWENLPRYYRLGRD